MSDFKVQLEWARKSVDFDPKTYDRTHTVTLSGGFSYQASSAPDYNGRPELVNPEEALLAALASCHMLTFLAVAANSKITVDSYEDQAHTTLEKNELGKTCIKNIILRPRVTFSGTKIPDLALLNKLHEKAHANCIVANSILAEVTVEARN